MTKMHRTKHMDLNKQMFYHCSQTFLHYYKNNINYCITYRQVLYLEITFQL